jgi:hypothetical protein
MLVCLQVARCKCLVRQGLIGFLAPTRQLVVIYPNVFLLYRYLDEFVEDEEGLKRIRDYSDGGPEEPYTGPPGKKSKKKKLSEVGAPLTKHNPDWSFDFGYPWENPLMGDSGPLNLDASKDSIQKKASAAGGVFTLPAPAERKPSQTLELFRRRKAELDRARGKAGGRVFTPWSHAEDVILCSTVVELGVNWDVASDVLAGVPDLGPHKGRKRSPEQCRERYFALLKAHEVMPAVGAPVPAGEASVPAKEERLTGGEEGKGKSGAAPGVTGDTPGSSRVLELNLPPPVEPTLQDSSYLPKQDTAVLPAGAANIAAQEGTELAERGPTEGAFTPEIPVREEQARLLLEKVTSSPDSDSALPSDFANAVRASQRHPSVIVRTPEAPKVPTASPEGLGFIRVDAEAPAGAHQVAPHPSHRAAGKDAFVTLAKLAGKPLPGPEEGLEHGLEQGSGWVTSFGARTAQQPSMELGPLQADMAGGVWSNAAGLQKDAPQPGSDQVGSLQPELLKQPTEVIFPASRAPIQPKLDLNQAAEVAPASPLPQTQSEPDLSQPTAALPPSPKMTEQQSGPSTGHPSDLNPVQKFLTAAADLGRLTRAAPDPPSEGEEELAAMAAGFARDDVTADADVSIAGADVSRLGEGVAGWLELLPKVQEPRDLVPTAMRQAGAAEGRYRCGLRANLALAGFVTFFASLYISLCSESFLSFVCFFVSLSASSRLPSYIAL